jgi:hypothetical protein
MDILGMEMKTEHDGGMQSALAFAARSVSTSYKDVLTPAMLSMMLRTGQAPEKFQPHLMALLDEVPLSVVVKAVSEAATPDVPAKRIMKNLHHRAELWKARRTVW